MILYFTGTGNSEYSAKRIGKAIGDETVNLFEKLRSRDFTAMYSNNPWVIVSPTYAWRIPRILQEWMENTNLTGSKEIYFIMTCGGSIGNAGNYLEKLCIAKHMDFLGCFGIVMPENYIAMYSAPGMEKALEIIGKAEHEMDRAADLIKKKKRFPQPALTVMDRLNSGIINDVFYPVFVHAKKFYVRKTCISCGKCAEVCPLKNIHLENGKPVWGKNCTHCMACICRCPREAIEYGKHSRGLFRYTCPK